MKNVTHVVKWLRLAFDNWKTLKKIFKNEPSLIGKEHTQGIEGNNCRLRHRIRRGFRKTCNFSKKEENHIKHFELVFHYINFGFVGHTIYHTLSNTTLFSNFYFRIWL